MLRTRRALHGVASAGRENHDNHDVRLRQATSRHDAWQRRHVASAQGLAGQREGPNDTSERRQVAQKTYPQNAKKRAETGGNRAPTRHVLTSQKRGGIPLKEKASFPASAGVTPQRARTRHGKTCRNRHAEAAGSAPEPSCRAKSPFRPSQACNPRGLREQNPVTSSGTEKRARVGHVFASRPWRPKQALCW